MFSRIIFAVRKACNHLTFAERVDEFLKKPADAQTELQIKSFLQSDELAQLSDKRFTPATKIKIKLLAQLPEDARYSYILDIWDDLQKEKASNASDALDISQSLTAIASDDMKAHLLGIAMKPNTLSFQQDLSTNEKIRFWLSFVEQLPESKRRFYIDEILKSEEMQILSRGTSGYVATYRKISSLLGDQSSVAHEQIIISADELQNPLGYEGHITIMPHGLLPIVQMGPAFRKATDLNSLDKPEFLATLSAFVHHFQSAAERHAHHPAVKSVLLRCAEQLEPILAQQVRHEMV